MVARLMVNGHLVDEDESKDILRHIKIFLTCYERFDIKWRGGTVSPGVQRTAKNTAWWISKYNFVCLLNMPELLRRFGPLRMLWDGDRKAEGGIPPIKRAIKSGLHGNWAYKSAKKLYHEAALKNVISNLRRCLMNLPTGMKLSETETINAMLAAIEEISHDDGVEDESGDESEVRPDSGSKNRRYKNYVTYKSKQGVEEAIALGMIISGVVQEDGTFGVVVRQQPNENCSQSFLSLSLDLLSPAVRLLGANYFIWHTTEEVLPFIPTQASSYFLLLPRRTSTGFQPDFDGYFYMITSDWREMTDAGVLSVPRMKGGVYL